MAPCGTVDHDVQIRTVTVGAGFPKGARHPDGKKNIEPPRLADGTTICNMSSLTIRTDREVEQALDSLTHDGRSRSDAARMAILEAERSQRRARLRAEA